MPLNIDWQQILLHLLNFVILFAGLWLLLYKPVKKFMNGRREKYEKMDADAEKKTAEAEEKRAEYEKKLASVDAEIEEKRTVARKEMDNYESMRKHAAEEEASSIVASARENAAREQERAVADARSEIADLVALATEKLVLHESTSEAYDEFLDAAERAQGQEKNGGNA